MLQRSPPVPRGRVPGFSRQQLVAAKAGVVGITSVVAGWFLGREEGDYAASMLVAAAILATMATAYEFLSYWLASWFGGEPASRRRRRRPSIPPRSSHRARARRCRARCREGDRRLPRDPDGGVDHPGAQRHRPQRKQGSFGRGNRRRAAGLSRCAAAQHAHQRLAVYVLTRRFARRPATGSSPRHLRARRRPGAGRRPRCHDRCPAGAPARPHLHARACRQHRRIRGCWRRCSRPAEPGGPDLRTHRGAAGAAGGGVRVQGGAAGYADADGRGGGRRAVGTRVLAAACDGVDSLLACRRSASGR